MGLPTDQSSDPTSTKPTDVSQLPPAALDLASKLFDFAREGKTAELDQYISSGIPINLTNSKGDTLLMLASYHGHLDTTKMLLEKGADANASNDRGQSIIAGAVFKGYDKVVKELFEKDADVRLGQPNAVDSARMFKREECLRLFGEES